MQSSLRTADDGDQSPGVGRSILKVTGVGNVTEPLHLRQARSDRWKLGFV